MSAPRDPAEPRRDTGSLRLPILVAVWCSFFLYSAVAAPVPAVNEPHYLCKAKHYWQPNWCAGDFFLESSNAHVVYFATIGSLTTFLSFEQSAWIGRILAIAILTVGWCRLIGPFGPGRWFPLRVCWLFLAMAACGNLSGEWLVGGVEGKVFSYGFLFSAIASLQRKEWNKASAQAGVAIAFHPLVGLWGLLATVPAWAIGEKFWQSERWKPALATRSGLLQILSSVAILSLCALPGLIPVIQLLSENVPAQTKAAATYIQVYYRLAHHLDPMTFLPHAWACYAVLIVVWRVLIRQNPRTPGNRMFDGIVVMSILFALAGLIIGWGPRPAPQMAWYAQRAQLLKFYPFRLADVLIPLTVSIGIVNWLQAKRIRRQLLGYVVLFVASLFRAHAIVDGNRYSSELRAEWITACRWIDNNLPADVLIHAPHNGWAFKWFAQRPEYVAFKDCPQDAAGIVEWNRRLNLMKRWFDEKYADEFYSLEELKDLRAKTNITHIFTDRLGPLELKPIYNDGIFQVYDLKELDPK